tara:strand:+ start:240 stop:521 length:282 start_codon:yes stop_codon:yes gene_type:complete
MSWLENIANEQSKEWQEVMLAHAYDLEEWGEAREKLFKLLENNQKEADEASIRSYISCCAESIGSVHPLPDLSEIVSEFYQKYGMENSKNIPE